MREPELAVLAMLAMLVGLFGCVRTQTSTAPVARPAPAASDTAAVESDRADVSPESAAPARPATRTETISIEGMEETFTFHLFDDPELPFTTYLPADMAAERVDTLEGRAVRFFAEFGGTRNEQAYLQVYFFPEGTTVAEAAELAERGLLHSRENPGVDVRCLLAELPESFSRVEELDSKEFAEGWWSAGYEFAYSDLTGERRTGRILVDRQAGVAFYVLEHYPEEHAEGLQPRARRILLLDWQWRETGKTLMRPSLAAGEEE